MWLCVKSRTCLTARPNQLSKRFFLWFCYKYTTGYEKTMLSRKMDWKIDILNFFSLISSNRFHKSPSRIKKQQQPQLTGPRGVSNCRRLHTILQDTIDFVTKTHTKTTTKQTQQQQQQHTQTHTHTHKRARNKLKPVLNVTKLLRTNAPRGRSVPIFPMFRS